MTLRKTKIIYCPICCPECDYNPNKSLVESDDLKNHINHLFQIVEAGIDQLIMFGNKKHDKKLKKILNHANFSLTNKEVLELYDKE